MSRNSKLGIKGLTQSSNIIASNTNISANVVSEQAKLATHPCKIFPVENIKESIGKVFRFFLFPCSTFEHGNCFATPRSATCRNYLEHACASLIYNLYALFCAMCAYDNIRT